MIQCRNNTVYACEVKFSKDPLPRAVISEVDGKIRNLAKPRNFTFRPVLIHVNGVDEAVLEERYFDAVIDFGELCLIRGTNPPADPLPPAKKLHAPRPRY